MFYDILNEIMEMFLEMSPYILLGLLFVGILNLFFNKDLIVKHTGKNNFLSVLKAAIFGVPLPLCSCGVVPTSVYMAKNGASRGSVISFLTSTPQTGIDSIVATYGMMGPVFAIFRPIAALLMGIISGLSVKIFEKENKQEFIEISQYNPNELNDSCGDNCGDSCSEDENGEKLNFYQRIKKSSKYAFVDFLDDISSQFIVGVILAGLIAYFLPEDLISDWGIQSGLIAMLIVVIIAVPMYVCATASIPIAVAMMMKGFSPGVAFVFLAAGPATNAASLSIITKVLGKKATSIYLISLIVLSIIMGYILDFIFNYFNFELNFNMMHDHQSVFFNDEFKIFISIIFLIMLVFSIKRKYLARLFNKKEDVMDKKVYNIEGMSCNHCVMNVKKAIESIDGVNSVEVNLSDNTAVVDGNPDDNTVKNKVEEIGYKVL